MNKSYSIGDVAEQTGTTEKQLRYWELRGYIQPEKMVSGKRYFRMLTAARKCTKSAGLKMYLL